MSVCRHSAIICPVIPDPSAIFKEMMMNGNKELKVYFRGEKCPCYSHILSFVSRKTHYTVLFFRLQEKVCTHRCQNPLNPAKLPLYLKTMSSSKTPDMYMCTAMPAVLLDLHSRQIHLEHVQSNLTPGQKAVFH